MGECDHLYAFSIIDYVYEHVRESLQAKTPNLGIRRSVVDHREGVSKML